MRRRKGASCKGPGGMSQHPENTEALFGSAGRKSALWVATGELRADTTEIPVHCPNNPAPTVGGPFHPVMGYGGGLIHRSVDEAMAAMAEYEADPLGYGRAAAGAAAAAAVDTSGYELVGGFQSDGGEMMERPAGVTARFTYRKS